MKVSSPTTDRPLLPSPTGVRCSILGFGFVCALIGTLFALRAIAVATLPLILGPTGRSPFFLDTTDGLPLPRLLDWNNTQVETLIALQDLHPAVLTLACIVLLSGLWLLAIPIINPTFQLFRLHRVSSHRWSLAARLEVRSLIRALVLLILVGVPLAAVWSLTQTPFAARETAFSSGLREQMTAVRLGAFGLAFWIGFHPAGLAGAFPYGERNGSISALGPLALRGIGFGLALYLLQRWGLPGPLSDLLLRVEALGTFHRGYWNEIAGRYLFSVGAVWFAGGVLFAAGARPDLQIQRRLLSVALVVVAAGLAFAAQRPCTAAALEARWDWSPRFFARPSLFESGRRHRLPSRPIENIPGGVIAGQELARRAGLTLGSQPATPSHDMLLFFPTYALVVRQQGITEDGLTASISSSERVKTFLEQRHYQTSLSWAAINHLYNVANLHFDKTAALETGLLDMTRCPHLPQWSRVLRPMFFTCAASPQNLALLDRWADEAQFTYPTRESLRMMGDLYRRFGAVDRALYWYGRADMPKSFLARIRQEPPLFHTGRVEGVFRLNGRPLAGVQVGVVPRRLNGLPVDLQPAVLSAAREIVSPPYISPRFPSFHPRPSAFRWISAGTVTDAQGRFVLTCLTEGEYTLVTTLPPDLDLTLPLDSALRVRNPPAACIVNYHTPRHDCGVVEITYPTPHSPRTGQKRRDDVR